MLGDKPLMRFVQIVRTGQPQHQAQARRNIYAHYDIGNAFYSHGSIRAYYPRLVRG